MPVHLISLAYPTISKKIHIRNTEPDRHVLDSNQVHKIVRFVAVPGLNMPKNPLRQPFWPSVSLWRFPPKIQLNFNQGTTVLHILLTNIQAHYLPSVTHTHQNFYIYLLWLIFGHRPSGIKQENPVPITSKVAPGFGNLVFQQTHGCVEFEWSAIIRPAPQIPDKASLIR